MRKLAITNGKVVHEEVIEVGQETNQLNYEGFYDTVIDDPDETLNVGDLYEPEAYVIHYFPEQHEAQPSALTPEIIAAIKAYMEANK
jgi:hypothetical protein